MGAGIPEEWLLSCARRAIQLAADYVTFCLRDLVLGGTVFRSQVGAGVPEARLLSCARGDNARSGHDGDRLSRRRDGRRYVSAAVTLDYVTFEKLSRITS